VPPSADRPTHWLLLLLLLPAGWHVASDLQQWVQRRELGRQQVCVGLLACQHDLLQQPATAHAAVVMLPWLRLAVTPCKDLNTLTAPLHLAWCHTDT